MELQKGGYVLFMRHGQTNPDQSDTDPLHLDNVQAQRQLTDEGRQQARDLGAAFRTLKIPIGTVTCSKVYRAQETAKLLGFSTPQPSLDVSEGDWWSPRAKINGAHRLCATFYPLRQLVAPIA